jgi:GDPmannose 4,6-dehydratase
MFACNGILFNHESPLRGETFVSRKITRGVAKIALGLQDKLYMGNLDAKRDWGHAKDYVEAMWLMLQQEKAEDFVIATGITTAVREFVRRAFKVTGITIDFTGEGIDEKGYVVSNENPDCKLEVGKEVVVVDERYFRPTEVNMLLGDASKAREKLGWQPCISLNEMIEEMVFADIELFNSQKFLKDSGFKIKNEYE